MRNRERNLDQLRVAARELQPLLGKIVFLGGCTTGLFITDNAAADIRPTKDVDVIVEVGGLKEYQAIERELRDIGFAQPTAEDRPVICRYRKGLLVVDVMPTDEKILGFGNPWYREAIRTANVFELGNNLEIRVVTAPLFVATKIAAFEGRGNGDFYGSHDLEDVIAVIDGRVELIDELQKSGADLRNYVAVHFRRYVERTDFRNALPGFISALSGAASRERIVNGRVLEICRIDQH